MRRNGHRSRIGFGPNEDGLSTQGLAAQGLAAAARRVLAGSLATALILATLAGIFSESASAEDRSEPAASRPVRSVLIFSVPTLTWKDIADNDLPNLRRVLGRSAIADLSTRTVSRSNRPGDGYGTFNAGTRTRGTAQASLAFIAGPPRDGKKGTDGDPVSIPPGAFETPTADPEAEEGVLSSPEDTQVDPSTLPPEAGERYLGSGTPAAEEFARRTGVNPPIGSVFNFGLVSMLSLNDRLLYDAEIGALGSALRTAGISRAVIANGDHGPGLEDVDFRREATLSLMDSDGLVETGRVGRSLLESSARAPFGTQYDLDQVAGAFSRFFTPRSVVMVEASDMIRSEEAKPLSTPTRQVVQRREALAQSDELLGRLLQKVDMKRDAVMVIAPYASGYDNGLTVAALATPGMKPGLLISGTTRRAGFVQIVDLAPTVLTLVGAKIPTSMEGTDIESVPDGRSFDERVEFLDEAFKAAVFRDSVIGGVSTFFVVIQLVLWVAAIWVLTARRSRKRIGDLVQVSALAVLGLLPATYLGGMFPFHRWGSLAYWAFVIGVASVLAMASYLLCRGYLVDPLMVMLGTIVGLLSADIITGGALQFNTVFGYTPTVAGRFDGMGNPAFSMFTAAGIILAGLIAYRIPGRRGLWCAVGLLGWVVLVDGLPIWGADVGGALALVPTMGIVILMLTGARVRFRTAIGLMVGSIVVVTLVAVADLSRPATSRTHLGRLLDNTLNNGFGAFETVILRKLDANLSVLTRSIWTLMLPVVFLFIGFVMWKAPWRLRTISDEVPQERAIVVGLCVAMFLGFALNDSGIAVPGMMLGVTSASLVHLMVRANSEQFAELIAKDRPEEAQPSGSQSLESGRQVSLT